MSISSNSIVSQSISNANIQGDLNTFPVVDSELAINEVPLDTEDIFTLETFESMMKERFDLGLDFYVVAFKEGAHTFFFEAAKFVEYFIKSPERTNPITKMPIEDFEVIWLAEGDTAFEHFAMKDYIVEYPNYLQLLWNDHTRSQKERCNAITSLGVCYERGETPLEKNEELAIELYEKAAAMGDVNAMQGLGNVYSSIGNQQLATFWFLSKLEHENSDLNDILFCSGRLIEGIGIEPDPERAFKLTKQVAGRGNYFGLIAVIRHLEEVKKDTETAKLWRSVLPEDIRDKHIDEVLKYYGHLDYNHEGCFEVPKELIENPLDTQLTALKV